MNMPSKCKGRVDKRGKRGGRMILSKGIKGGGREENENHQEKKNRGGEKKGLTGSGGTKKPPKGRKINI